MDIRLLEYFLAVAKYGNITRASEQLHVTQPTISRQLMELEENMGTRLLIRGKRQVTLTEAGVLFQQRAEKICTLFRCFRSGPQAMCWPGRKTGYFTRQPAGFVPLFRKQNA